MPFVPRFVNLPQANFCGGLPLAGIRNFPFLLIDNVDVFFYGSLSGERRGMPFYAAVRQFAAGKFLRRAPACGNPQFPLSAYRRSRRIFGKGEYRLSSRTSNENLPKSAEITVFWQGSYYSCPAYHKTMCLVILILPPARLMKNLKAHSYFRKLKRFLPFSDPSKARQRGLAQDDENGFVLLR